MTAYTVTIEIDDEPLHPRRDNYANVGMLYTFPRVPYDIGDETSMTANDILGLAELYKRSGTPFLPIYMFDHSGQSFYTEPTGDQWDESFIGFIFLNTARFLELNGWKRMSPKRKALAIEALRDEVKAVNAYHNTTYYYASIEQGYDVLDSCSGFESEEDAIRWAGEALKRLA